MSKSTGNFMTLYEAIQKFSADGNEIKNFNNKKFKLFNTGLMIEINDYLLFIY